MRATPGQAPMVIVRESKGQYPWEWTQEQVSGEAMAQEARAR